MALRRNAVVTLNKTLNRFGAELNRAGVLGTALSDRDRHRRSEDELRDALETERSRAAQIVQEVDTARNELAAARTDLAAARTDLAAAQADLTAANAALARHRNLYPDSLYEELFPSDSLRSKRFYNIGAGNWRHPYWTNVDYSSDYYGYASSLIDINWDISKLEPLEVDSGTAELVFSSHTIEHLQDHHVEHLLAEVHRILKPGGVARFTAPNAELIYRATMRRDGNILRHFGVELSFFESLPHYTRETMPLWVVNEIASQLHQGVGDDRKNALYRGKPEEVQRILEELPMTEAFDHFTSKVDFELQRLAPGHHVSWWTNEKLCNALKRAGFNQIVVSVAGGSVSPMMRNRDVFDYMMPTYSIFVEGIKD